MNKRTIKYFGLAGWGLMLLLSTALMSCGGKAMVNENGVRLDGVVLEHDLIAMVGVAVSVTAGNTERTVTSNKNGYFDLGILPAGEVTVVADFAEAGTREQVLILGPGHTTLRVTASDGIDPAPGYIDGSYEDDSGSVSGITVSAENLETDVTLETVTDGSGDFELSPLPTGRYRLQASRDGEVLAETTLHLAWMAREYLRVTPDTGFERDLGFLNGKVIDEGDEYLEGATVRITHVQTDESAEATTGDYGNFELETGLTQAIYHVQVFHDDQLKTESRALLHPHMVLDIHTIEGMWEGGARAAIGGDEEGFHTVTLFYGTDRSRTGSEKPGEFYGGGRGVLELGKCEVSIPLDHQLGELESPAFWRFEFREDPEKHVVLLSVEPQQRDDFVGELRDRVTDSDSNSAFVFVHGYNVDFVDAARRTGQMAYDLQFDGAPILYSWPSKGDLQGYMADEVSVEWTVPHLREFLELVAVESGAETVHLIAHSMGNRALTSVLREFAASDTSPRFEQIALMAPDIDADIFKRDIAPQIKTTGKRVTLYASATDGALKASKQFHAAPRAGDASEDSVVVTVGVDTIDVTGLDTSLLGHSYFAENNSVIADLIHLIHYGEAPDQRDHLEAISFGEMQYWRFETD